MTDAELAVLSIVAEGPIFGYHVQELVAERGLRAWTNIGTLSIYYILEKLERQGLITSISEPPVPEAARREYRITAAGYGVLQTAVMDLLSTPREYANSFELGLANAYVLRVSQIRTALTAYRSELQARLTQARHRQQVTLAEGAPFHVRALFAHRVAMLEAEAAWVARFVEEWESHAPPEEAPPLPEVREAPRMQQVILPHAPDSPHRLPTKQARMAREEIDSEAPTLPLTPPPQANEPTPDQDASETERAPDDDAR